MSRRLSRGHIGDHLGGIQRVHLWVFGVASRRGIGRGHLWESSGGTVAFSLQLSSRSDRRLFLEEMDP